jgi:non-specific serine/threonine protein kinase/serine/threonine-protein kinase
MDADRAGPDYCDRNRLTLRERLDLFLAACDGVQHAHQKAIIHRDLKPANLLVVDVDGKPTPRIIDFGLAKAAAPPPDERALVTRVGSFVGTPGYMSPEQADPSTPDVDTRTDVYSLGAVLYELLAGALPFDASGPRPLDEVLRRLREDDPPRPSTRIGTAAAEMAAARATDPSSLARQLRGDLDGIVMKALERDRARRYGSPAALAEDIRRYLLDLPILARPASRGYRLRKYVRRHRLGVAAAAIVAIVLMASAVVQAVELRRITRERDRANRITDFMTNMFRVADPSEVRGANVTAREILDKAASDIESGLANDPSLQAQMMDVMGSVYSSLGLVSRAQPLLERAVEVWTHTAGADSPSTLASSHHLADTLGRRARYADAEQLERRTWEASRRVLGPAHVDTLRSMTSLAITLENEGRLPEAERLDRDALELARRALGDDHPDTLRPMNNLGNVLMREARFAEAERYHSEALERRRRVLGAEHPQTIVSLQGLAGDRRGEGRLAEAEALDRQTVAIRRHLFGAEHQQTLSATLDLARDIARQGRPAEAEALDREGLEIARRILGPEHTDTVSFMINLALTIQQQQRYAESEALNRMAIEINTRRLGPEHFYTLAPMNNLARDLLMQGKLGEAEPLARQTVDISRRTVGPAHPNTIEQMYVLFDCFNREHHYGDAEAIGREILEHTRHAFGPDHVKTAEAGYDLGTALVTNGKRDEAIAVLGEAVRHGLRREKLAELQTDARWKPLRGEPGFTAILDEAKRRATASLDNRKED